MPSKRPQDCCEGFRKIFYSEIYHRCVQLCEKEPSEVDQECCMGVCGAHEYNILKDFQFDKETAIDSLKKRVVQILGNNTPWLEVSKIK